MILGTRSVEGDAPKSESAPSLSIKISRGIPNVPVPAVEVRKYRQSADVRRRYHSHFCFCLPLKNLFQKPPFFASMKSKSSSTSISPLIGDPYQPEQCTMPDNHEVQRRELSNHWHRASMRKSAMLFACLFCLKELGDVCEG